MKLIGHGFICHLTIINIYLSSTGYFRKQPRLIKPDYKISTIRFSSIKRLLEILKFLLDMAKRTEVTFTIRKAVEIDKDDIYRVHTTAIRKTCSSHYSPNEVDVWVRRQSPDRYVGFLKGGEIVIAETQDKRVLGFQARRVGGGGSRGSNEPPKMLYVGIFGGLKR